MKKILDLILLAMMPMISLAYEAGDGYYFDDYMVFVTVHEDNSCHVQESFTAVFLEPSHGLYRSIPNSIWVKRDTTEAQDRSGAVMRHYYPKITDVVSNREFAVFEDDSITDVRIGSEDYMVSDTTKYFLGYDVRLEDDRIPQADLFFHSVMGPGNPCSTNRFYFRVYFDKPLPQESLDKLELYKGEVGDSENYARQAIYDATPDSISGYLTDLQPYEAVSLYVPLPEGYFCAPANPDVKWAWLLWVLALGVLIYVIYKEFSGSDKIMRVVTFYPPKGVSSAEIGTIYDCSADDEDLISLIPSFANRELIDIKKDEQDHLVLQCKGEIEAQAPEYEKTVFEALFANGKTFDTTANTDIKFGKAWLKAREQLRNANKHTFDKLDGKSFMLLILGLLLTAFAVGYADTARFSTAAFGVFIAFFIEAIVMYVFVDNTKKSGCQISAFVFFAFLYIVSNPAYLMSEDLYLPSIYINGLVFLAFLASLFTFKLSHMTEERKQRMGEIEGLREFIRTADQDRLKMLLTDDGQYFYQVLPYAIAFGMADRWAAQFKGLTVIQTKNFAVDTRTLSQLNQTFTRDNIRHGIMAEQKRVEAAEAAKRQHSRSSSSSGSSWSSSRSYSRGGGGYSGGGSGGGGSRRW